MSDDPKARNKISEYETELKIAKGFDLICSPPCDPSIEGLAQLKEQIVMNAQPKPTWNELAEEIRNAWIQQTHAFYPLGSTTIAEATELAQYEYEQSESESLFPSVENEPEVEIA